MGHDDCSDIAFSAAAPFRLREVESHQNIRMRQSGGFGVGPPVRPLYFNAIALRLREVELKNVAFFSHYFFDLISLVLTLIVADFLISLCTFTMPIKQLYDGLSHLVVLLF